MNIFEVIKRQRNDIITWCSKNFARKLNKNLGADKAKKFLVVGENGEITTSSEDVAPDMSLYATTAQLDALRDEVMYKPMDITSFYVNGTSIFEKGLSVAMLSFKWETNKAPKLLTVNDQDKTPTDASTSGSFTLSGTLNMNTNNRFVLKATDEKSATDTQETYIYFYNGVYYGVSNSTDITNATILGFTKNLQSSRSKTFTVTANAGQYIYYCLPKSYGECTFSDGATIGGFELVKTHSFTNASGHTEDYYIYRSTKANLGLTTIIVS